MHLIAMVLLGGIFSVSAFAQDSCGFLHQQTQAFSDAGQRGDGAAMAKMLDPDVIFFNETGEKATRTDMAGATPPAAGTPIRTITTTDWDCKVRGRRATSSSHRDTGRHPRCFSAAIMGRSPASFICAARTALCSSASSKRA